uniref:Uncharacterized protein n=1 Tax=Rhizophora mucronata TaxID=61149 RepID=A0A2P2P6E4_RHIMU
MMSSDKCLLLHKGKMVPSLIAFTIL